MATASNDAPALKAATVGISVDSAVDIAKESSDIILLETGCWCWKQGVLEAAGCSATSSSTSRWRPARTLETCSASWGPARFCPSCHAADPGADQQPPVRPLADHHPTDQVDADWLTKPRKWEIGKILRFILFIGPISSIFDYVTFFLMLYIFNCWHNPACSTPAGLWSRSSPRRSSFMSFAPTNPVHPKLGQLAAHPDFPDHRSGRRLADGFAPGDHAADSSASRRCSGCI